MATILGPIWAIRVFVPEVATVRSFYRDQLGLAEAYADDTVLVYSTGTADLIVEAANPDDEEERLLIGRYVGASFAVSNIESAHEALSARGVLFASAPEKQAWGGTLAHVQDPAGNILTLMEPPGATG